MESGVVNAVGAWFYSQSTDRLLYLMRSGPRHAMTWDLPGGKCAAGEALLATIKRECQEELGAMPEHDWLCPVEQFTSADRAFRYHTFFCPVSTEFVPRLNHEHSGYAWLDNGTWPRAMHPGLWATVNLDSVMAKIRYLTQRSDVAVGHKTAHSHTVKVGLTAP